VFQINGKPQTITQPRQAVRTLPKQPVAAEDMADEQFASAVELDDDLEMDDSDLLLDDSELLEDED